MTPFYKKDAPHKDSGKGKEVPTRISHHNLAYAPKKSRSGPPDPDEFEKKQGDTSIKQSKLPHNNPRTDPDLAVQRRFWALAIQKSARKLFGAADENVKKGTCGVAEDELEQETEQPEMEDEGKENSEL